MAAISQLSSRNQVPAILHQKIKGYPTDFRVITSMLSNIRTFNLTYGLPLENTVKDTVKALLLSYCLLCVRNFTSYIILLGKNRESCGTATSRAT